MQTRLESEHPPAPTPELPLIAGDFTGKDILSLDQFDPGSLDKLFQATNIIRNSSVEKNMNLIPGCQVGLYFGEASRRTISSFSVGTSLVGGDPHPFRRKPAFSIEDPEFTYDILTLAAHYDAIVIRHPETGAIRKAWETTAWLKERGENVGPVINAGDGGLGEHPTQALLDLYTIKQHKGRLDHLTGVIARDLLYGRTVKSLIRGLALYPDNTIYLLSPPKPNYRKLN